MVQEELIGLTEDLVRFQSTKNNPEEIEKCLEYIKDYFSDDAFLINKYEDEGKNSIVISFDDTKEVKYLLHGHIDVVEASDKDMFEPKIEEGKIYGRGSGDMKAGVACLMKLIKDLAERDVKPSVALMIVSDEEIGGFNGADYLFNEIGYQPEFAISAEPNNMEGYLDIVAKQKGILQLNISTKGRSSHGSRPWKGKNAAEKLWEIYDEEIQPLFPDNKEKTWETTCNLGTFEAGEATNSVPDSAEISLDIRFSKSYSSGEVLEDIREINDVEVGVILDEPMLDNNPENNHIRSLKRASKKVTGRETRITRKEPGSDMRFLSQKGIPAVVFGPEGYNSHGPDEYAVIDSFEDYYRILETFIS